MDNSKKSSGGRILLYRGVPTPLMYAKVCCMPQIHTDTFYSVCWRNRQNSGQSVLETELFTLENAIFSHKIGAVSNLFFDFVCKTGIRIRIATKIDSK